MIDYQIVGKPFSCFYAIPIQEFKIPVIIKYLHMIIQRTHITRHGLYALSLTNWYNENIAITITRMTFMQQLA